MSYQFSCAAAGAYTCGCKVTAESEAKLREILADHVVQKHKVARANDTLLDHFVASATRTDTPPS